MVHKLSRACALCVLLLAGTSARAMPVGVRLAMQGRAIANAAASGEVFPVLEAGASAAKVADALSGARDNALAANIADAAAYSEFRAWAMSVGAERVKASGTAWLSYALGASGIVPEPQEGDLAVDDMAVDPDGCIEAVFSLEGVDVGSTALEARLKTVFGVEGASALDGRAFSSDNVGLSLEPTGDGRVRAVVVPPQDAGSSYFMRVRLK